MKKKTTYICIYLLVLVSILTISLGGVEVFTAFSTSAVLTDHIVVIDPGHGGVDGGAVSCTGVYESKLNLEIAKKVNDLMHLLGLSTIMIRETDRSVYTEGTTIAAKKVSDIKERVRIVNTTPNALFISIHQNTFQDSRYGGAQAFYNLQAGSQLLADKLQDSLREEIDPSNHRKPKRASGIYLMEHINCPGVLIECGFLSNPIEESHLRSNEYQNKLACVITTTVSQYLNT